MNGEERWEEEREAMEKHDGTRSVTTASARREESVPYLGVRLVLLGVGICCAAGSLLWAEDRDAVRNMRFGNTKPEIDTTLVRETVRDTMWVAPEEVVHVVGDVTRLATAQTTVLRSFSKTLHQERRLAPDGELTVCVGAEFVVTAGFDLTGDGFEVVRHSGEDGPGLVEVFLPAPRFLSCRLVPEELEIETSESHWEDTVAGMTELLPEVEAELQEMAYEAALEAGLLEDARENALGAVQGVLRAMGIEEVSVSFTDGAVTEGRRDG